MYKLCKTEQSARRQRQLEQGLLKAMLQHDYEEISISELCESMAVPRKSFYRYFSSKDGALYALIDHTLMEYESFARETGVRTLLKDLERFFRFWQQNSGLVSALERSGLSGVLIQRGIAQALQEGTAFQRLSPMETDYMKEQATTFAVCGLMSLVVRWHSEGCRHTPQEMAKITARLITQPLFPSPNIIL
jgi:AcrR family transcriptional regulator